MFGQMGDKVYTMTAEQFAALKSITVPAGEHEAPTADSLKLEIETSVPGKPFVLEFKANGMSMEEAMRTITDETVK